MSHGAYDHISFFAGSAPPTQLRLLTNYVLEVNPVIPPDVDGFRMRLELYARTANIPLIQAKKNVCIASRTEFNKRLQKLGIDVV